MDIKEILEQHKELREKLFVRGFLITTDNDINADGFPFYGQWKTVKVSDFNFWLHPQTEIHIATDNGKSIFVLGHCYNPFTMEKDEDAIIRNALSKYGTAEYQKYLNQLTGIFLIGIIVDREIDFQQDASGMQYCCYGTNNSNHYIASHMQLIGDICNLKKSDYVERLVHYRWYRFMLGNYLPGNITCFDLVKRVVPNTSIKLQNDNFIIHRFYPYKSIKTADSDQEYKELIEKASNILRNTMVLISQKWSRPAISLTGGIDSNTTFAAANGSYDKYTTFSYVAMERESIDADAANEISEHFRVPFTRYNVSNSNSDYEKFEAYKAIFIHNDGEIGNAKDDDTRKKIELIENDVCDVEVKSWISETIRAYAYKYFGKTKFPAKISARIFTSLYKIFLFNRKLAIETDKYFKKYFEETSLINHLYNYDYTDFFVWEMMHGGKCSLNIGVMKACYDITIPYNNRDLLDLLLSVPVKKRISDQHHMDMKKLLNKELYDMNIRVINQNETKLRKRAINLYFAINSHIPF